MKMKYEVTIGAVDNANVEEIEDFMQQLLLDLYEQGQVESIKVIKNGYTKDDNDIEKVIDIIDDIETTDVSCAIELISEFDDG